MPELVRGALLLRSAVIICFPSYKHEIANTPDDLPRSSLTKVPTKMPARNPINFIGLFKDRFVSVTFELCHILYRSR